MLLVLIRHLLRLPQEMAADIFFLTALLAAWFWPRAGERLWLPIEKFGAQLARRKGLVVIGMAATAILVRLSLLWYLPVPQPNPRIHDEFGYLLAADTFAHGRLTNPPHPMWMFLDTIHVNQHPTYMAKYPPAQGAVMALGQLLGHPWIGVLLSAAIMCAAVLWMLQGWLPQEWALLGGVLVLLKLGVFSYWMNSYWGGAVAATGGALVVGALPRLLRSPRPRHAIVMGLGILILANSRPFEGAVVCLPVVAVVALRIFRRVRSGRRDVLQIALPIAAAAALCVLFVGYYNWRVTGSALLSPYTLNERTYDTIPLVVVGKALPWRRYANPQFNSFYNLWYRKYWALNKVDNLYNAGRHFWVMLLKLGYFLLWPELLVALLALPWILTDRRVRFLLLEAGVSLFGSFWIIWYLPHYSAPVIAVLFALVVQSLRHLRRWTYNSRPVGIGLTRAVLLCTFLLAPFHVRGGFLATETSLPSPGADRARIAARLEAMPGPQLAVVRYAPSLEDPGEWVFNGADIDASKIVWAREIPGIDIRPLLNYFRGRQVWLVEPGASPPRLTPYPVPSLTEVSAQAQPTP